MLEGLRPLYLPFMSHGMSALVWLHVVSDIVITIAYAAIPITLVYFVRRRQDNPFNWMFLWFGLFAIGCAATHAMEASNTWHANYLIVSGIKVLTALASVPTAFLILRLIPQLLAFSVSGREPVSLRLLHAQDEERRTVAREVHDGIGQYIGALNLGLATLRGSIEEINPESEQILDQCQSLIGDAAREIRTVSYLLHPPMIEQLGLTSALQWLVRGYTERSGIRMSLEMPPDFGRLKPDVELALFRLVQEALSNIHRHSGSRTAVVRLVRSPKEVVLELKDAGRGMRLSFLESTGRIGVGIPGMRERVKELNGRFAIDSSPEMGVTIRASVPVGVGP
jgi:signal transduction histidine kinase